MSALGLPQVTPSLETVGPGFAGFVAIFVLAVATVLLLRSMVRHLRKVRYSPDPAAEDAQRRQETTASPADKPRVRQRNTPGDTPGDAPGRQV